MSQQCCSYENVQSEFRKFSENLIWCFNEDIVFNNRSSQIIRSKKLLNALKILSWFSEKRRKLKNYKDYFWGEIRLPALSQQKMFG